MANTKSVKNTFRVALMFCPVWFMMNYTFNASLQLTSVSSNTILSSISAPATFILCVIILREKFTYMNALGTALT